MDFTRPGPIEPTPGIALAPDYAEFCAVSQILKKPGFGADIRGEIGGHAVFYLQGACRAGEQGQTTLVACDAPGAELADGVGLSVNEHFRNAKWVATPGSDFFFNGGLAPDQALTHARYEAVQAEAKRRRIFDGIAFHDVVFEDMPQGWTREDWKYEMSVSTDYAIGLGRGRFCARVPLNPAQLHAVIDYLNAQNAPYRDGGKEFHWSLFQDNCMHLAHNALAAAGVWADRPIYQPLLIALFDFPVPRNEFVDLMERVSDRALLDPGRLYADAAGRRALLEFGQLPLRPGALMESRPPQQRNDVYDTQLGQAFYDDPIFGDYQTRFDALVADPDLHDARRNIAWVEQNYRDALARQRPLAWWLAQPEFRAAPGFADAYQRFYALLERSAAEIGQRSAALP